MLANRILRQLTQRILVQSPYASMYPYSRVLLSPQYSFSINHKDEDPDNLEN